MCVCVCVCVAVVVVVPAAAAAAAAAAVPAAVPVVSCLFWKYTPSSSACASEKVVTLALCGEG